MNSNTTLRCAAVQQSGEAFPLAQPILPLGDDAALTSTKRYLEQLRWEVEDHPAVYHPILGWLANDARTHGEFLAYGLQHYALVDCLDGCLEELQVHAPDEATKQWVGDVLADSHGEVHEGIDLATLYRAFLESAGASPGDELDAPLHDAVLAFVETHRCLCRDEGFVVGLGAIGPGLIWSQAPVFDLLLRGMLRSGFEYGDLEYFTAFLSKAEEFDVGLTEVMTRYGCSHEQRADLRRGLQISLSAQSAFWDAVQVKIRAFKRGELIPVEPRSEQTLAEFRRAGRRVPTTS